MEIGITLSGGGIRCIAHLAAIQVMEKHGIIPEIYSGASGGAFIAALLGAGLKPPAIMDLLLNAKLFSAIKPAFAFTGLFDVKKAFSFAIKHLPETFEELDFPLSVAATNLQTGESEFFSSGPLLLPVLASCCMPAFFKPVKIEGQFYVDGGLLNNMPVEPIRNKCNKLIGINSNPVSTDFKATNIRNLLERTFLLTINANVAQRKQLCDVYLEPDCMKGYKVFDLKKAEEIYANSVIWMEQNLPEIKNQLVSKVV